MCWIKYGEEWPKKRGTGLRRNVDSSGNLAAVLGSGDSRLAWCRGRELVSGLTKKAGFWLCFVRGGVGLSRGIPWLTAQRMPRHRVEAGAVVFTCDDGDGDDGLEM